MTGCYVNTFLSPLSLERETECLKKVAQNDKEAKDELILHNMRLVAHVTKKYAVSEDEIEELISIGTIGLIKAVSSFKADYGNRFATFAIRCIENEILMHFRSISTKLYATEASMRSSGEVLYHEVQILAYKPYRYKQCEEKASA